MKCRINSQGKVSRKAKLGNEGTPNRAAQFVR